MVIRLEGVGEGWKRDGMRLTMMACCALVEGNMCLGFGVRVPSPS